MRTERLHLALILTLTSSLSACGGEGEEPSADDSATDGATTEGGETGEPTGEGVAADVTYYADVKPILDARCVGCHDVGEVGPFPLTSYEQALQYGELLAISTGARAMPPWPADSACREYSHDTSLTDAQIDTLQAWVEAGKPAGDPADEGAALPVADVRLDRVDLQTGMTEGHVPTPTEGIDEHRCFLIDWPATEPVYITGFQTHPGNRAALHHFVGFIIPEDAVAQMQAADAADPAYGWECGAGTAMGGFGSELFATWVPGSRAAKMPEGTGQLVQPGSKIMLNMHYNVLSGDLSPDQTTFDFQVEEAVEKPGKMYFATDFSWPLAKSMNIPAGSESVVHSAPVGDQQFGKDPYTIHVAGLHMHTLGTAARLFVERASGEQDCLVDIPSWDFDWQMGYNLAQPMHVGEGDRLHIECEYDNSAANQPPGEAPKDVNWGEDTFDEMCLGLVFVTEG